MGDMVADFAGWLGKNPEILILLIGLAVGYFLGKR